MSCGNNFYAMLKNAFCVVIPLKDINISSGQLVVLYAMQLKVPIIATNSKGISDYIINGYNGFLIMNNKEELISTIKQIKDKQIYDKITSNAYKDFIEKYSSSKLGENLGKLLL